MSASNAVASQVDTGNAAAREFIPQEILDDPAVFPTAETLAILVFTEDLGDDNELYEDAWAPGQGRLTAQTGPGAMRRA